MDKLDKDPNGHPPKSPMRRSFDSSLQQVHLYTDKMRHDYLDPLYHHAKSFAEIYPITSAFLAIFLVLSFFPVTCFIGFSLFTLCFFLIGSLTFSLLIASAIIFSVGTLLLGTLTLLSLVSAILTLVLLICYFLLRLYTYIRTEPSLTLALKQWTLELIDASFQFYGCVARIAGARSRSPEQQQQQQPPPRRQSTRSLFRPPSFLGSPTFTRRKTSTSRSPSRHRNSIIVHEDKRGISQIPQTTIVGSKFELKDEGEESREQRQQGVQTSDTPYHDVAVAASEEDMSSERDAKAVTTEPESDASSV